MRFLFFYIIGTIALLNAQEGILQLGELPAMVSETSGLIYHKGNLITHNDSGNKPQLYELDSFSRAILRVVTISNAGNIDWEDIAKDDTYIYIGDFGNFNGDREDLLIYRIAIADYESQDSVTAERIAFRYQDQQDFTTRPNSDWDAEALFVLNNELVVLTKQWQSLGTVAYRIPKTIGSHIAQPIGSYPINGLVTGASYNPNTEVLFMIGYSSRLLPFAAYTRSPDESAVFNSEVIRNSLNIGFAQVEAITHTLNDTYFFSTEFFSNDSPPITSTARLFSFMFAPEEPEEEEEESTVTENALLLFQPRESANLMYELQTNERIFGRAIFDGTGRLFQYSPAPIGKSETLDISALPSAIYYLTFYTDTNVISAGFPIE